jgi:hypothetical protein
MNREQRRAKAKKLNVINKVAAWNAIETRIQMNRADDTTHIDQAELLNGPLLHLTMMQTGKLTDAGFVDINEAVCAAFCLAGELYRNGDTEAKQQLNQTTIIYTTAADSLAEIGTRCVKVGRYGASGGELQAIRACLDMYVQLIAVAPRGLVMRALKQAEKMVTDQLKAAQKLKQEQSA